MRAAPAGTRDFIKRFELGPEGKFAADPYEDPPGSGKRTCGYGHQIKPTETFAFPLTEGQADTLLDDDISVVMAEINRVVSASVLADLTDNQLIALADWVFNEGDGHLESSTLLKMLNAHALFRAGNEILRWDYVAGEPSKGLLRRREAEYALWQS